MAQERPSNHEENPAGEHENLITEESISIRKGSAANANSSKTRGVANPPPTTYYNYSSNTAKTSSNSLSNKLVGTFLLDNAKAGKSTNTNNNNNNNSNNINNNYSNHNSSNYNQANSSNGFGVSGSASINGRGSEKSGVDRQRTNANNQSNNEGRSTGIASSLVIEDPRSGVASGIISKFISGSERSKERQRSYTPKGKIQTSFKASFPKTSESIDATGNVADQNKLRPKTSTTSGKENVVSSGYLTKKVNLKLENTNDLRASHEGFVSSTTKNSEAEKRIRNEMQMSIEALTSSAHNVNHEEKENSRPKSSDVHKSNGLNDFLMKKITDIRKRTNSEEERPSTAVNITGMKKALERENEELSKKVQKKIEEQKQKVKGGKINFGKNATNASETNSKRPITSSTEYLIKGSLGSQSFKDNIKDEGSGKKYTSSFGVPAGVNGGSQQVVKQQQQGTDSLHSKNSGANAKGTGIIFVNVMIIFYLKMIVN